MKRLISVIIIVVLMIGVSGCSVDDITDQVSSVMQSEDENVLFVKGGHPIEYPDKTYGECFDDFFVAPTWKYFVGTQEGPDDDGDGEPDYVKTNMDIVEFTGYCTYQDVEVKALVQFVLDKDEGTFEATYLSFNEVPQTQLILCALIEKAFMNGEEGDSNNSDEPEVISEEIFYDEEQVYYGNPGEVDIFVGTWWDMYSQRCHMTIENYGDEFYYIDIQWSGSAYDNSHWVLIGTIAPDNENVIEYWGSCWQEHYDENGNYEEYCIYEDGQGRIFIGDTGRLYWEDFVENSGQECEFAKEETYAEDSYEYMEYIIPDSNVRYLEEWEVDYMDSTTLRLARNEILARHGYIFQSEDLVEYFNSTSWYYGVWKGSEFDYSVLNEYEIANIELIKQAEALR